MFCSYQSGPRSERLEKFLPDRRSPDSKRAHKRARSLRRASPRRRKG